MIKLFNFMFLIFNDIARDSVAGGGVFFPKLNGFSRDSVAGGAYSFRN